MLHTLLITLCFLLPAVSSAADMETWEIRQAQFLASDAVEPPVVDASQWQDVALPDNWGHSRPGIGGNGWYRLRVHVDAVNQNLWAVYLPKLSMNTAVWLNGVLIGQGGSFDAPMSRNWNTPLLFSVPSSLLKAGTNVLDIRIKAYANNGGGLASVYLGPEAQLKAPYQWRSMMLNGIPTIAFFLTLWLGFMTSLLWCMRRKETMYGWFSLGCLFSALYLANHFVRDIPMSRELWEWLFPLSIDAYMVALMMFVHRWIGKQNRLVELVAWFWLVTSYLFMFVLSILMQGGVNYQAYNMIHSGAVVLCCYLVWLMVCCWRERREKIYLFVLLTFGFNLLVLGVHDWYVVRHDDAYEQAYLMPYGGPVLLVVIAVYLMFRFARLQRRSEQFASELQDKVEETTEHLNMEHETIRQLEKEQAVGGERERMMRDLHDGLGGQLVSALSQANNLKLSEPGLKQTISDALLDLRLVIDSLDEDSRNLSTLLGMLRVRINPQLQAASIQLHWKVQDDPELSELGHESSLHLLRIVQEAITNAIRHSRCSEIELRIANDDGAICIEVADNGVGKGKKKDGRGTGNMRRRSEKIGAQLHIASSLHGTKVQIYLPVAN